MLTEYGDGMLTCYHCGPLCVEMLDDGMEGADRRWRVTCASCRLSGPERPSTDEAKETWNRIQRGLALQDAVERTEEAERLKLAAFHALRDRKTPEGTPICGQCGATGHVKDECDRLWAGL